MSAELARDEALNLERLEAQPVLARHLAALLAADPRLVPIAARAGQVDLRRSVGGFEGLARIVVGQQLSTQSADAIWRRFAALEGATVPHGFLSVGDDALRAAGFSRGKVLTLRALANAIIEGQLDLAPLATLPAAEARALLTAHKGIGPWTAELYLMFAAGHPDVFPAGDIALQHAAHWGLGLDERPSTKSLGVMAEVWAPWRSAAAHLFWRYYRAIRSKEGVSTS
jgi:DNA-3-methyladenine glycosylase II